MVFPVLYGYLLKANERQELFPSLISEWNYDDKNNKYSLTLGDEKFHNGREIESEDLEFSIIRGFISSSENYNKVHFSDIAGVEHLRIGMEFKFGMCSGIKIINFKTLEIHLKASNPIFLINFTVPFAPLVPKEELKSDYYSWKTIPIGAGPYKVDKDYTDYVFSIKARSQVLKDAPQKIEYHTARKNCEYDLIFDRVVAEGKEKEYSKEISKYPFGITAIFFHRDNYFSKNINFRKAIHHAIDRNMLLDDSGQFKPAYEMMVRPKNSTIQPLNPFDLKLAMEYFKKLPKDFFDHEIVIGVYSTGQGFSPLMIERIKVITLQLSKLGLKIKFEPNYEKFSNSVIQEKFAMKFWTKVVDLSDPIISFGSMTSVSPYCHDVPDTNGELDKVYSQAIQAKTFEERLRDIQGIAKIINEKALLAPLLQKYVLFRFNPKTVITLGENTKPMFLDLSLVSMSESVSV